MLVAAAPRGKLLKRRGVELAYPTLRRFTIAELGFGRVTTTLPVADGRDARLARHGASAAEIAGWWRERGQRQRV